MHTGFAVVEKTLVEVRRHAGNASADPLALTRALVMIAELIEAHPERYPEGAGEVFSGQLFARKRAIGRLLLQADQMQEARAALRESLSHRVTARAVLLWLATWVQPTTFHRLVRLKRAIRNRLA